MDKLTKFAESRSGDHIDIMRVEATYRRWKRDIPYINRPAFGRYAPNFCFGEPGSCIDLRKFNGSNDEFILLVATALQKRYYQVETQRKYLSCLKRFLNWLTIPINRINDKCIFAYLCSLSKSNIKPSTYSLHFCALRTIFDCFCNLRITTKLDVTIGKEILARRSERLNVNYPETSINNQENGEVNANFSPLLTVADFNRVFAIPHSNRDTALFIALPLLNIKLKELLNIRVNDIDIERNIVKIWGGAGREERDVEYPTDLTVFFVQRMNELSDNDYLFSSFRDSHRPLTGQTANKIIKQMMMGISFGTISCHKMKTVGITADHLTQIPNLRRFYDSTSEGKIKKIAEPIRKSGTLQIKIGELVEYQHVVSADVEFFVVGISGERIKFRKIRIHEQGYRNHSVTFPDVKEWREELLWVSREMKERITGDEFRERMREIITEKYLQKRENCYIRKKRKYKSWRATG